jgi:hypothetical protein
MSLPSFPQALSRLVVLVLAVALAPSSAVGQWTIAGSAGIDNLGDVDGNGVPDVILYQGPGTNLVGTFLIVDGQTGAVLRSHSGAPGDELGTSVAGIGDVDQDGFDDYLACAVQIPAGGTGYARVYSGLLGNALITISPSTPGAAQMGTACRGLGDVNGDGIPDFAVIVSSSAFGLQWVVYDGATFTILHQFPTAYPNVYVIRPAIAGVGDQNGDGIRDVVVGKDDSVNPATGTTPGGVHLYSGASGALLNSVYGLINGEAFGCSLTPIGDVNFDGLEDVAVGAYLTYFNAPTYPHDGSVRVVSLTTGAIHSGTLGFYAGEQLGAFVSAVGDLDADGIQDYAAGTRVYYAPGYSGSGTIRVYSGLTAEIIAAPTTSPSVYQALCLAMASPGPAGPVDYDFDGRPDLLVRDGTGVHPAQLIPTVSTSAGAGNAGPPGAPENVLFVNGSPWLPLRRAQIPWNAPVTVSMTAPSTSPGAVPFVLFGWFGVPTSANTTVLPFGIGTMVFPPLDPVSILDFVVADSFPIVGLVPVLPSTPTPWMFTAPVGLPPSTTLTLQPVLMESAGTFKVGNAIVVMFQ